VNPVAERLRSVFEEAGRWELHPLEYSGREVADIARLYKPDEVAIYLGPTATEENVKGNEHLSTARRIHFATHGLISEKQPQYSGLVLSLPFKEDPGPKTQDPGPSTKDQEPRTKDTVEDGLLQVYEIFNLTLNADLVVLSACETGLGKEVKGEGLIGLTRAFLYAGTPSVAVSLWSVADRSTARLMVNFYEGLDRVKDKAEALRQAKLELMQSPRYAHPYYWAPFILVGERQ
jgi:CHAT domain-containing protein